jgi:hypothetical protein
VDSEDRENNRDEFRSAAAARLWSYGKMMVRMV